MAGLFPLSRYQQFDENGQLLVGARLFLFDGGTTTPRAGYRDSSLTTLHPNPIVADAAGRLPLIYLANGFYRQRLTTATGVLVFDDDGIPVVSTSAGGSGTSVDPLGTFKTRDIKIRFDNQQIDGYVRLNGMTIGTAASGASERANGTPGSSDVQALYEELWPFSNIVVLDGGKGANAPADFAANKKLVLPDCAGRGLFGMDNLGAGARGILTSATVATPTLPGSIGGNQQITIAKTNLPLYDLTGGTMASFTPAGTLTATAPAHTHTQQGTFTQTIGDHSHTFAAGSSVVFGTNHLGLAGGAQDAPIGSTTARTNTGDAGAHTNSITISGETGSTSPSHTHTFNGTATTGGSVTISTGGSGTAITNMPPVMTFMIYVRL